MKRALLHFFDALLIASLSASLFFGAWLAIEYSPAAAELLYKNAWPEGALAVALLIFSSMVYITNNIRHKVRGKYETKFRSGAHRGH